MISFRFHVVSITAIFLAIAIGVVVGSTYVDNLVVDQLKSRINTVERRVDEARAENAELEDEVGAARDFIDRSSEYAVTDRLTDVPVLVVATRGVDEGSVERLVVLARRAGGTVPGIVWLEPRWGLESDDDRSALAEIVGGSDTDDPEELWASAWAAVVEELEDSSSDLPGVGAGGQGAASVLPALEEAGFLSRDSLDDDTVGLEDLVDSGPRVLVVSGVRAEEGLVPLVPVVVEATVEGGLPTVVADIHVEAPEGPERGEVLVDGLPEELRDRIILVDDADREEGRVAAVLSLHDVAESEPGLHYGYGDGADAVLPGWTAP
jgi:hypothetical protein